MFSSAASSTPAEIRIAVAYDATVMALTAAQILTVQTNVATAVLVLRKFYKVRPIVCCAHRAIHLLAGLRVEAFHKALN